MLRFTVYRIFTACTPAARLAKESCLGNDGPVVAQLEEIQCRLQDLGSHIATPRDSGAKVEKRLGMFCLTHGAPIACIAHVHCGVCGAAKRHAVLFCP